MYYLDHSFFLQRKTLLMKHSIRTLYLPPSTGRQGPRLPLLPLLLRVHPLPDGRRGRAEGGEAEVAALLRARDLHPLPGGHIRV